MRRGYSAPCGEVTKAVARLLSPLWRGCQICGEITYWRGYLVARLPVTSLLTGWSKPRKDTGSPCQ